MADVEKVARAIPDEAVEAALGAYFRGIGFAWKRIGSVEIEGNGQAMRAAIQAALAAMEANGYTVKEQTDHAIKRLNIPMMPSHRTRQY